MPAESSAVLEAVMRALYCAESLGVEQISFLIWTLFNAYEKRTLDKWNGVLQREKRSHTIYRKRYFEVLGNRKKPGVTLAAKKQNSLTDALRGFARYCVGSD